MSDPAFVQSASAQDLAVTSVTTPAITTTNGNFLVAQVARKSAITLIGSPVSDNYGNSWLNAWRDGNIHGVFGSGGLYYAQNITGGAGHTVTFTLPSGSEGIAVAVAEFANVATTFALNSTAHTQDAGPGIAIPPIVSGPLAGVETGQLLIGSGTVSHGTEPPASTGMFTDLYRANSDTHGGVILSYALTTATGPYHYAYNIGFFSSTESYGLATFKGSSIAYVQQTGVFSVGAPSSITTPAITTTSGHLIVVIASSRAASFSGTTVTDSKGNTYVAAWVENGGGSGTAACYYVENCVGGAGHTFTLSISGDATLTALSVAEFSGVLTSGALDQTTHSSGGTRPYTTADVTTTTATQLLIGGGSVSGGSPLYGYSTVPLDWNTVEALDIAASSSAEGVILAYQIAPSDGTYEYGMNTGAVGTTSFEAVGIASFLPGPPPAPFVNPETSTIQIRRMRRTPHLNKEHKRIKHNSFELLAQVGEGTLTGQGIDPQITLRWSDDGGRTWSREHTISLGKMGEYRKRVIWRRLGQARDRVYEITDSDPVNVALISAYLDADVGTS